MPATHEQIYATIVEHCQPAPQLPKLQHLPAAEGARCGTRDPDALLAKLRKRFSPEQLREAGVLAPAVDGATAELLHEDLAMAGRCFIALRDALHRPFDLITARGSLRFRHPAVFSFFRDLQFQKSLRKTETIIVTISIEDTIFFRSLGIAATLATGLDQLRGQSLDKFMRLLPQNSDVIPQSPNRLLAMTVLLIGWSLNRPLCVAPARFEAMVGHLQNLERYLDVPLGLQVWRPRYDELKRLEFVLENDRSKDIALRVLDIIEAGSGPLLDAPKVTLSAAYARLQKEASEHTNEPGIRYARQQLAALIQAGFVNPLIDEAEAASDPLERSLKLTISHLLREQHSSQLDRLVNRYKNRAPAARQSDREDLQDWQARLNLILKLLKQTSSCKKLNAKDLFPFDIPRSRS